MTDYRRRQRAIRDASTHYVYVFRDDRGRALYVGCTSNIARRLGEHSLKYWWSKVSDISVGTHPSRGTALDAELRLIHDLQPWFNIQATEHDPRFSHG